MKRQIIAKINNIANQLDSSGFYVEANALTSVMKKLAVDRDFDDEGTYDEMFGPMNDDDSDRTDGKIIVSNVESDVPRQKTTYTVSVFIDGDHEDTYKTHTDENGVIRLIEDVNQANELADKLKIDLSRIYPNVDFEVHKLKRVSRGPGDPYDAYKDRRGY
jgi:uncharacterized protein involved in high-affinity Fe2+ transport